MLVNFCLSDRCNKRQSGSVMESCTRRFQKPLREFQWQLATQNVCQNIGSPQFSVGNEQQKDAGLKPDFVQQKTTKVTKNNMGSWLNV